MTNNNRNATRLEKSLKLLVKTSFVVFIGIALSKILGYAYRVIIARYYGPEAYGLFALALMISGWFIALSALGLLEGLIRFIPFYRGKKEDKKIRYILKFSTVILAVTSIISGILMFILAEFISVSIFHNSGLITYLQIFSIIVPLTNITSIYIVLLRAFEEIPLYSLISNILQNVIKVFSLGLFVLLGIGGRAVPISYLLGIGCILVIAYTVSKYKLPQAFGIHGLGQGERKLVRKELTQYSLPLLFFAIISNVFYWIDSLSIGFYKDATAVGFYNAAVPIAALLAIAPELFMQLFFPMINKEYAKNNLKLIEQMSKQVAKWILIVNIPVFAILIAFPGAAINFLFGNQYLVAESALRILSVGTFFSAVFIVSNYLISMAGRSKLVLMNVTIAATLNLVLNSILVPMERIGFIDNSSGLNGAALATLISLIVFNLLFVVQAHRYLRIVPLKRQMLTLLLISIISTAVLFYLRTIFVSNGILTLTLLGGLFMGLYIALVITSKALDENDLNILRALVAKLRGLK